MLFFVFGEAQNGWFGELDMKGKLNFFWGYNRGWFSNSDIQFNGPGYQFILHDVVAKDRPVSFAADPYFTSTGFTIPQYNYKIGFFVGKRLNIGIGMDHMKYIMVQDQQSTLTGNLPGSDVQFTNEPITVTEDFLTFEHSDGLNYLNVEAEYYWNLYRFSEKHAINVFAGGGGGALIPKSNVKLMNFQRNDEFHIAGFGLDAKVGASLNLFKFLFLQTEFKTGYINMPDVLTMPDPAADRASHDFWFSQWNFVIGGYIQL